MNKSLILAVVASSLILFAQETRHEVVRSSSNPVQDAKPNNDSVPEVYALNSHLQRMVVLRFKYNADLLGGLQNVVKQEKIRNAVIVSAFGSVRNYHIHEVGNRDFPVKDILVKNPTMPADILGMSGLIIDGRVHPHITLATPDRAFGGHLEPDTNVFTFAVVTLAVLDDSVDLSKVDDWSYR